MIQEDVFSLRAAKSESTNRSFIHTNHKPIVLDNGHLRGMILVLHCSFHSILLGFAKSSPRSLREVCSASCSFRSREISVSVG